MMYIYLTSKSIIKVVGLQINDMFVAQSDALIGYRSPSLFGMMMLSFNSKSWTS